jgi:hypothetical protein
MSLSVMKALGAALPEGLHRGQMRKLGLTSKMTEVVFIGFSCLVFYLSSAAFWKANLTGESSAFLKLDRWIIMINATPLFMSIQT